MRHCLLCGLLAALIGCVAALPGGAQDDPRPDKVWDRFQAPTPAQKEIITLARLAESGKDISDQAADLRKKYPKISLFMHGYRPREKKGIGVGPTSPGDGIEQKLIDLGKRALPATALKRESADLIKVAYINIALAEIAKVYVPAKPKKGKGKKEWAEHSASMKKSSEGLIKAIKDGEPAAIKKAAVELMKSCGDCHADFRDS